MKLHALILAGTMLATTQAHAVCGPFTTIALWQFDGVGADPADTITGTVADGQNLTAIGGCVGGTNCRSFNGINSALIVPYRASWSSVPANGCMRISAVIKPSGAPPANGWDIVRNADYPAPRLKMEISDPDAQRHIRCEADGSTGGVIVATGGPDLWDGQWHELVCRIMRSPDALEAWVGTGTGAPVLVSRIVAPIGAIMTTNPLTIGRHPEPVDAGFYWGSLDNFQVRTAVNAP